MQCLLYCKSLQRILHVWFTPQFGAAVRGQSDVVESQHATPQFQRIFGCMWLYSSSR